MESLLFESIKTAGPTLALIVFFVWWSYKRETSLTERIHQTEDFVKNQLLAVLNETTATIGKNTEVLELTREAVNNLPCKNLNCGHEVGVTHE